ncbi:phosphotransferase [Pseudonocardia sp. CA-107938]|uniref:phosphotransferase n=1 Tax=Pseudonocardia sp. CA-107938 TaxID=3240021 RepID=UPI003D94BF06
MLPTAPRTALLGAAAVEDAHFAELVAAQLGEPRVVVLTCAVATHPYDRPAITTAARHLVTGTAETLDGRVVEFGFFVKVVHAYRRSPLRFAVPAHLRERAAELVPWRTEPDLYRSELRHRLPRGLAMPRPLAVHDLDDESAALWLERVPTRPQRWDVARHARAAHLMGRFAASPAVAALVTAVHGARTPRVYADGWLAGVVQPAFSAADLWAHPLVRDAFDSSLRRRIDAAFEALPALLDELDEAPVASAHGDACPANLLVATDRADLVMVDLGFCGRAPLGTDLGQLVLGEVAAGHRPVAELPALETACLDAYAAGVAAEAGAVDAARLERIHAVLMTIFAALPAVPVEHLDDEPTPALRARVRGRASVARFVLDRLHRTRRYGAGRSHVGPDA